MYYTFANLVIYSENNKLCDIRKVILLAKIKVLLFEFIIYIKKKGQKDMNRNNNNNKKDVCIIARCTEKEKEIIHRKAVSQLKSDSKYILDSCMAGTERKTDKQRKQLKAGVEFIELANEYIDILFSYKTELSDAAFDNLYNKFIKLEVKSLCLF